MKAGSSTVLRMFAMCPPGLEDILCRELEGLGIEPCKIYGGAEFSGDLSTLYSANLWSRVAGRILVRIGSFRLVSLDAAAGRFARYPWEIYLGGYSRVRIRASVHKSRIYHSGALKQRLLQGISARLGREIQAVPDRQGSDYPQVFVRMSRDRCLLSLDSSGEHLHKRGFKKYSVKAPLRENLAAAMLYISGWDRRSPLLDPFCGSGTILIEALLMASSIPPGRHRRFAFMDWRNFSRHLWTQLLRRADRLVQRPDVEIIGQDRSPEAVEATLFNIENAGFSGQARVVQENVSAVGRHCIQNNGFIVTNPPYGHRLRGNYDIMGLYSVFGRIIRARLPKWHLTLLYPVEFPGLRRALGLNLATVCRFSNGGIRVAVLSRNILSSSSPSCTSNTA